MLRRLSSTLWSREYVNEIPIRVTQQQRAIAPRHQRCRHNDVCPRRVHSFEHCVNVLHFKLQDRRLIRSRDGGTDIKKLNQVLRRNRKRRSFELYFSKPISRPRSPETGKPLVKLDQTFNILRNNTNRAEGCFSCDGLPFRLGAWVRLP